MVGNMDNNLELKKLLQTKQELFLAVEAITNDISEAPIDQIVLLLDVRGDTLEQVISIDNQIKAIVGTDEKIRSVLNCTCEMSALQGDLKELFEAALRVKSVVNRIIKNEDTVRLRIEHERDSLLDKIENINSSSNVVAESYKRSVKTGFSQGSAGNKKKTI